MKNFQFPSPPRGVPTRAIPQRHRSREQLPKNNSWAAEEKPLSVITEKETPKTLAFGSGRSKRRALEELKNVPSRVPVNLTAEDREELWTDIGFDEGPPIEDIASTGKENTFHKVVSNRDVNKSVCPLNIERVDKTNDDQSPETGVHNEAPFAIHMDESERTGHPQPLSAHPGKVPTSGPHSFAPGNVNSSHSASANRVPWYRQRYKNGKPESHRSSIYGPGALARRVQQEVMITVNVELDVLRREMGEKFIDQKKWLVKELMNGQEWTLRVEEENRKLREELAKERRKRAVDREGLQTVY